MGPAATQGNRPEVSSAATSLVHICTHLFSPQHVFWQSMSMASASPLSIVFITRSHSMHAAPSPFVATFQISCVDSVDEQVHRVSEVIGPGPAPGVESTGPTAVCRCVVSARGRTGYSLFAFAENQKCVDGKDSVEILNFPHPDNVPHCASRLDEGHAAPEHHLGLSFLSPLFSASHGLEGEECE